MGLEDVQEVAFIFLQLEVIWIHFRMSGREKIDFEASFSFHLIQDVEQNSSLGVADRSSVCNEDIQLSIWPSRVILACLRLRVALVFRYSRLTDRNEALGERSREAENDEKKARFWHFHLALLSKISSKRLSHLNRADCESFVSSHDP